jgi:hypothetical protein
VLHEVWFFCTESSRRLAAPLGSYYHPFHQERPEQVIDAAIRVVERARQP